MANLTLSTQLLLAFASDYAWLVMGGHLQLHEIAQSADLILGRAVFDQEAEGHLYSTWLDTTLINSSQAQAQALTPLHIHSLAGPLNWATIGLTLVCNPLHGLLPAVAGICWSAVDWSTVVLQALFLQTI